MIERLAKWLIFGILIALVPLLASWTTGKLFGVGGSLVDLLAKGELYIITAALCAAGIGEVVGSTNEHKALRLIFGGFTTILLLLSALLFAAVSNQDILKQPPDPKIIFNTSISLYLAAVISSTFCSILSERK